MSRLPEISRDQLDPEEQKFYDEIVGSRGGVRGPYGALLHSPDLAHRVAHTGTYLRFECDLPNNLKEVVILTTAREIRSQFEYTAHAQLARQAGVPESTIRAITEGTSPQGLAEDEALLAQYALELLRNRKITDATFNAVRSKYGNQGVVDLTALIGHYLLVGQILAAFDVGPAPGVTPELPE